MRLPPFNPRIAVAIGIIAISTTTIFAKLAQPAPASIITNYKFLFAFLVLLPFVYVKHKNEIKLISTKTWLHLAFSSLLLTIHFVLLFRALENTTVTSAVLIMALQPVMVLLASRLFYKEKYSFGAIISIVIIVIGSALVIFGDLEIDQKTFFGDLFVLASLVFVSTYDLTGQKIRRNLSLITHLCIVYGFGSFIMTFYNLFSNISFINYSGKQWGVFILLGTIPAFVGLTSLNWALRWLKSQTISAALVVEPIIATIFAYIFLHLKITASQWLGGTVIIFGLLLFTMSTYRKTKVTISKSSQS